MIAHRDAGRLVDGAGVEGRDAADAFREKIAQDSRRAQVNYYTQPREETSIAIERVQQERQIGPAKLYMGVVEVTRQVTGYRRKEPPDTGRKLRTSQAAKPQPTRLAKS